MIKRQRYGTVINSNAALAAAFAANLRAASKPPGILPPKKPATTESKALTKPSQSLAVHLIDLNTASDPVINTKGLILFLNCFFNLPISW